MAKNKKATAETQVEELVMDVMPGADPVSEEEAKAFEVDLNFDDVPEDENEEVEQEVDATPEEEVVEKNQKQKQKQKQKQNQKLVAKKEWLKTASKLHNQIFSQLKEASKTLTNQLK